MKYSLEELALFLDKALSPQKIKEIEQHILQNPNGESAKQLAALDDCFDCLDQAKPITPPAHLLDQTLAALEEKGLISDSPTVPMNLHAQTMERLEQENLVQKRPMLFQKYWSIAAAYLLAIGLCIISFVIGQQSIPAQTIVKIQEVDRPIRVEVEVPTTVIKYRDRYTEVPIVATYTQQIVQQVEVPKIITEVKYVTKEVIKENTREIAAKPKRVEKSSGIVAWSHKSQAWKKLRAGEDVQPGTILKGTRPRSSLSIDGKKFRLLGQEYVWAHSNHLEPFPASARHQQLTSSIPQDSVDLRHLSLEDKVYRLTKQLNQGSAHQRNLAQQSLVRLKQGLESKSASWGWLGNKSNRPTPTTAAGWLEYFDGK